MIGRSRRVSSPSGFVAAMACCWCHPRGDPVGVALAARHLDEVPRVTSLAFSRPRDPARSRPRRRRRSRKITCSIRFYSPVDGLAAARARELAPPGAFAQDLASPVAARHERGVLGRIQANRAEARVIFIAARGVRAPPRRVPPGERAVLPSRRAASNSRARGRCALCGADELGCLGSASNAGVRNLRHARGPPCWVPVANRTSNRGCAQGGGASLASLMASFEPGLRTTAATTPLPRPQTSTAAPTKPSRVVPAPTRRVGPGLRRLGGTVERVGLDRVDARRQALPAGAAGDGVAVALVHRRLRLRVRPRRAVSSAARRRAKAASSSSGGGGRGRVPCSSRRPCRGVAVAPSSAAAAVTGRVRAWPGPPLRLLPQRWLEQHYSAPLRLRNTGICWALALWDGETSLLQHRNEPCRHPCPRSGSERAVMLIFAKAGVWDPEFEIEDHFLGLETHLDQADGD